MDTCRTETFLSEAHSTIHLQVLPGGNLQWSLYSIENEPNPVTYYIIERDDFGTGNFLPISTNVPGNNAYFNDINYASYPNAAYRAQVAWSISCTPTRTTILTSHSNIKRRYLVTGIDNNNVDLTTIYPNPTDGLFYVNCSDPKIQNLKILNMLGEVIYQTSITNQISTIDLSEYTKGIYFVQLIDNMKNVVNRKIVVK